MCVAVRSVSASLPWIYFASLTFVVHSFHPALFLPGCSSTCISLLLSSSVVVLTLFRGYILLLTDHFVLPGCSPTCINLLLLLGLQTFWPSHVFLFFYLLKRLQLFAFGLPFSAITTKSKRRHS